MITTPTVLVLGAGASMPYGFPSGQGLVDLICEGDNNFKRFVGGAALVPPRDVSNFIATLKESDSESIDIFLGRNPEFEKAGKAAIVATLLPKENEWQLKAKWREARINKRKLPEGGHWYKYLFNQFLSNTSFEKFDPSKLSIITFNYDRSLEHYLFTTLRAAFYRKLPSEYIRRLNALRIIHIYGHLGYLEWQNCTGQQKISFGFPEADDAQKIRTIRASMQGIKTMSEGFEEDDADIRDARQLLSQAVKVYFLGFGYDPVNLKILGIESLQKDKNISGTSLNLSFQRKLDLSKYSIASLKWNGERNNPGSLFDEDVYDFLYQRAILY